MIFLLTEAKMAVGNSTIWQSKATCPPCHYPLKLLQMTVKTMIYSDLIGSVLSLLNFTTMHWILRFMACIPPRTNALPLNVNGNEAF